MRRRIPVVLSLLFVAATASACASPISSHSVTCSGIDQPYLSYMPVRHIQRPKEKDRILPAVMLLHGAGDHPTNMVDAWKRFADKHNIILLAPELPRAKSYEDHAPEIFRCVVEDAKQFAPIDPQRVYLFGNSMGGYLAYDGAMFQSQYFAAIAVHAMRIADDYTWILGKAARKIPVAIYIGDRDQFFSVDSVHKTRDLLRKSGFPVHYVELENHDHNYYARSDEINDDTWDFLKGKRLPSSRP